MPVYLDYNATTPLDPRVLDAMQPWLTSSFGNSASRDHRWGWDAAQAVEDARLAIAQALDLQAAQIVFTSGATESLNAALRSYVGFTDWPAKRLITCATEHDAVLACCKLLARTTGVDLQILPVDTQGHVDRSRLEAALNDGRDSLVALMAANNEIGTVHPIGEIAQLCRAAGAVLVCDMAQAVGKFECRALAGEAEFAAISAHKFYGPPGVGVLSVPAHVTENRGWTPLLVGGGQESELRAGSLNVSGIVGMAAATRIVSDHLDVEMARLAQLRDQLEMQVLAELSGVRINGDPQRRICNTTSLGFVGVDARILIRDMDDVGVSTQAACSTGSPGPSHVLKALGLSDEQAYSCIRVSVGRFTTGDEIDYAGRKLIASVHKLRRSKSLRT